VRVVFSSFKIAEFLWSQASASIDKEQVIRKLRGIVEKNKSVGNMDHSYANDGLGALGSGVADRMTPSDASQNIVNVLADIGPACTRSVSSFRETLADITSTGVNIDEPALARIIYFFSDKEGTAENFGASGMSNALLGSLLPGRGAEGSTAVWSLRVVAQVLAEDYAGRDWVAVATYWDFPGFILRSPQQFRMLLELYRAGAQRTPPLGAFTTRWRNYVGQVSLIESIMAAPPAVYMCPLNEEELADASTAAADLPANTPNPQCWASLEILQRLLYLSDIPSLYRRVRDLFVKGLLGCPEVLLCALVRLQLHVANAPPGSGRESLASVGVQMKTELMRELIPLFFRPNGRHRVQNGPAALRRLYAISPTTVTAACFEAWRSTVAEPTHVRLATLLHIINIVRVLPSPENAVGSLLNGSKDPEFSIAVAFVMADSDFLQLKPWLAERLSSRSVAHGFAVALVSYLAKLYTAASPRSGDSAQLVSLENVAISLQTLNSLDVNAMSQPFSTSGDGSQGNGTLGESVKALTDACLNTHPSLRGSVGRVSEVIPSMPTAGSGSADDVEEMATAYFQQIYTSEQSIGEVVAMLKRFKTSGNAKENEIFACMVHNLFDEYRFFSKYPEKELRITGILFGTLIQEQLVSSITLGIALRYVLEALRKPPSPPGSTSSSSGKMFRFGMFALEQFKGRLHEWPQYCSHIVQIPHLREGYADLVAEIENAMAESQNRPASTVTATTAPSSLSSHPPSPRTFDDDANSQSGSSAGMAPIQPIESRPTLINGPSPAIPPQIVQRDESSGNSVVVAPALPPPEPRIAVFGPKLGKAVKDEEDDMQHVSPPDAVLDRVQFLVNNLAPSNVEQKAQELRDMLDPKYFGWLGHFLVVKRITVQANFHGLYLSFLDQLGEYGKGLVEAILASVYVNIGKLLRSPKITTSTSERSLLKNLGSWLGQITLARNRPVPQLMLDCKELLFQGYETGKLIAVAPFVAKTLEGAKNSIVFRPPNPWLMAILGVFRSLYNVEDLKMNIKFEVEVLCKNIGIKLEEIPLRDQELAKRIPPVKERNPDFNIKSSAPQSMGVAGGGADSQSAPSSALVSPDPKAAVGPIASSGLIVPDATADGVRALQVSASQDQQTLIPNLAAYVSINSSLSQLLQQAPGGALSATLNTATLKQAVPIAVDRAIREIISPVVERSVTIACLTTKEIVTKDFAMESDENKIRKAGQLMVANLAGSLALVTCREPLRTSVSNHLRQLLTTSSGRTDKHTQEEQNIIDQCVQICATDNLDLGCMLIEKAATEKAVRDVDEALAKAINARRKHREQTGQPYYDMSIFSGGNQRYPAALPEQLRPKPGGLRNEHFQLYESFQRMPRTTVVPANLGATNSGGSLLPSRAPGPSSSAGEVDAATGSKVAAGQPFSIETLSALAAKLDNSVVSLLTAAGQRAPDIKLTLLPPDHQVKQIISAVAQIMPNANPGGGVSRPLTQAEQDAVLGFSQSVFKRLYELSLTEPLRLEALVALLETINGYCPKLGKDIGTWATYAPTNTDSQRRLHRTVLLLLVRSDLLQVQDLDGFLAARSDSGRNHVWVEFAFLFIRTAFLERIASPPDFPKLIDLMTSIADGRSQANAQVTQTYRKPILRMLEEIRAFAGITEQKPIQPIPVEQKKHALEESSLSAASLSNFALASRKAAEASDLFARHDPPNAKQQVTELLDVWVRLQNDGVAKEQSFAPFLQRLQQFGVGRVDEHTERFLRLSALVVVDAVLKSGTPGDSGKKVLNFTLIDIYCDLLSLLFKHMNGGGSVEQVASQRLSMLNKILGVIARSAMWDCERMKSEHGGPWDQRPWFRILLNLVCELNKPDPTLDAIGLGMLSVFGAAFHVLQPLAMPGKESIASAGYRLFRAHFTLLFFLSSICLRLA
jgi:CCR4-NOT transcription complex subunit 1